MPPLSGPPEESAPQAAFSCFRESLFLGLTSFGGPAAHIGYFENRYVRRLGWIDSSAFAQLAALCQVLPGPASSQMNFLIGWIRAGGMGALLSFIGFTLPSVVLMILAAHYAAALGGIETLVFGMKVTAAVIVAQAVWSMARKLCTTLPYALFALLAAGFCALFGGLHVQLAVIFCGGLVGYFCKKSAGDMTASPLPPVVSAAAAWRALRLFIILLVVLPLAAGWLADVGPAAIADVFYRTGALVFGGGHVVLPLIHDSIPAAREDLMLYYGLAQALPGPLFSIAASVGYSLLPTSPFAGAALATGFIFLPGLLVALAGYYFWQKILALPRLLAAISGIGAATVGLLGGALVDPVLTGAVRGWPDAVFIAVCFALAQWKKLPAPLVIVLSLVYAALRQGAMP